MKRLIRSLIFTLTGIYLLSLFVPGFSYSGSWKVLILSGLVFWLVNLIGKPVIKLVMLPINFVTMGFFSWASNLIVLFITVKLVPGLKILGFDYPGFSFGAATVSSGKVSPFWSAIIISISLSLFINFSNWLCSGKK